MGRNVGVRRAAAGLVLVAVLTGAAACGGEPKSVTEASGGQSAANLGGAYQILRARNPDGTTYRGEVNIAPKGAYYKLLWEIAGSESISGVALRTGDVLGAGWSRGAGYGVAVYRVVGGKLLGRWASFNSFDQLGTEELEGPDGLNGTYTITRGSNPDTGKPYGGTVQITPVGEVYKVAWKLDDGSSVGGVGLVEQDTLVVGFSVAGNAGVTAYTVVGGELRGRWVRPGTTEIGNEDLGK